MEKAIYQDSYTSTVSRASTSSGYLPGLDGLRAFAILGVLIAHDPPWSIHGHSNELWRGYGGWGVQLFFALSGVLISWRMMEEEAKVGRLQLGKFYLRRLFRIQPAAYTYLLMIALLGLIGSIPFSWHYWTSAILSYTNFVVNVATPPGAPAFIGHFWTLSVEEHFYLIVSLLFFLTAARWRPVALATLIALLLGAQEFATRHGHFSPTVSPRRTYWTIQLLLVPSLLALIARIPSVRGLIVRFGAPWIAVSVVFIVALIHEKLAHVGLRAVLHYQGALNFVAYNGLILIYGFGVYVVAIMLHPRSLSTRLLEWRPLRLVGRWSYSIYLWHVLFFIPVFLGDQVHSSVLMWLTERPWKYIATAIAALASYYLIEKPAIRLGHRIAPPVSAGHADLDTTQAREHTHTVPVYALDRQP